jgi:hypothetical protein
MSHEFQLHYLPPMELRIIRQIMDLRGLRIIRQIMDLRGLRFISH